MTRSSLNPSIPQGLIAAQAGRLRADFALSPVTAAEIEFYLHGEADAGRFWQEVEAQCGRENIALYKHEKEKGRGQYEIALSPLADPSRTAADTARLRHIVSAAASAQSLRADFSSLPLQSEPGSGLHVHVHLNDTAGKNTFHKHNETMSEPLKYAIGGLLAWLPDCMAVFAPRAESYGRFKEKSNAPTTVSWGANNRTCAVRLPDKPRDNKHIEHRASGAEADPQLVMAVILAAIHDGLARKLEPGAQIYGDASLAQYNLPRLPGSLDEAVMRLENSEHIKRYFSVSDLLPSH